jgi:hypothetical protein
VPAVDDRAAARQRLKIRGLAVPGMPIGSPGIEVKGHDPETYDVMSFGDREPKDIMQFRGSVGALRIRDLGLNQPFEWVERFGAAPLHVLIDGALGELDLPPVVYVDDGQDRLNASVQRVLIHAAEYAMSAVGRHAPLAEIVKFGR